MKNVWEITDKRPNYRVLQIQTSVFVLCARYTKNESFKVCTKYSIKGKTGGQKTDP